MRHLEKHHGNDSTAKALLRILCATKNRRCSLKQFERPTTVKKEDNSRTRNLKKKIHSLVVWDFRFFFYFFFKMNFWIGR